MGCDIHTLAEVKRNRYGTPTDEWRAVREPVFDNAYFYPDQPIDLDNVPMGSNPYQGRNYDLFALLANVRNGYGFAGVPTGDAITPIAAPRGVPSDASKKWKKYVNDWGSDLHSVSYFTARELLDAEPLFRQHQRKTGVITGAEYEELKLNGSQPESWSGWISGQGVRVVTPEQYDAGERGEQNTYVQYHWETTLFEATQWFWEHTVAGLVRIAPKLGPHPGWNAIRANGGVDPRERDLDGVRIVFGFDN